MPIEENILSLAGAMADYSFSHDGNGVVVRNIASDEDTTAAGFAQVTFTDGVVTLGSGIDTAIAAAADSNDGRPSLTALSDGGYVLVWESYGADGDGVRVQRYDAAGELLNEGFIAAEEVDDPSVTELANGAFIVAWASESDSTETTYIQTQRFDAQGIKVGSPVTVASSTGPELDDAVVRVLDNGNYVVTWLAERESGTGEQTVYTTDLYAQLYKVADGSKVGSARTLYAAASGEEANDQMVLPAEDGGFLVAWTVEEVGAGTSSFYAQSFDSSGAATSAPRLLQALDADYAYASYFSIAAAGDGYVVSWVSQKLNDTGVGNYEARALQTQHYDASLEPVGDEATVSPFDYSINGGSIASLGDGGYLATWATHGYQYQVGSEVWDNGILVESTLQTVTVPDMVLVQRFDASGAKVGDEITVVTLPESHNMTDTPVAVALEDGGFVVSWETTPATEGYVDYDDVDTDLHAQRFDSDGNPVGALLITLAGDDGANTLVWTDSGEATLKGEGGDDILAGGSGDDRLDGGSGTDTAVFAGDMGGYALGLDEGGNLLVTGSQQGSDRLDDVELLQFDDGTLGIDDGRNSPEAGDDHLSMEPAVAALNDGGYVIAWQQDGGVRLQRYDNTGDLLRDTVFEFDDAYAEDVVVAALGDGFISAVSVNEQLHVQPFDASGNLVGEALVIEPGKSGASIEDPALTALEGGGYALAWAEVEEVPGEFAEYFDDGETVSAQVYVQVFDASHQPAGDPVRVDLAVAASDDLFAFEPGIAALDDGDFVIVWERENDENIDVYLQRFNADGHHEGNPIRVNGSTGGDQFGAEIVTLEDGSQVVAWVSQTYQNDEPVSGNIYMQRYAANGSKLGKETRVNAGTTEIHGEPAITALKNGGYVIAWGSSDEAEREGDAGLYAQIFDKNGVKVGNEILVARDENDLFPAINATDDGGFVITWESLRTEWSFEGATQYGDIHSQRFDANGNSIAIGGDAGDNSLVWTGAAAVTLKGEEGNDQLQGGAGNDSLDGGEGNDALAGGAGADALVGGKGNDRYVVDNLKDQIVEATDEGQDTVEASLSWSLGANQENLTLTGTASLNGTGNELDNELTGNSGNNTLTGGAGNDVLKGAAGLDKLLGGAGDDTYIVDLIAKGAGTKATVVLEDKVTEKASQGSDTLTLQASEAVLDALATAAKVTTLTLGATLEAFDASATGELGLNLTGNKGNNELTGNAADNLLNGSTGNDRLYGGAGADILIGGAGADTLYGGEDADIFRFVSTKDLGLGVTQDVIEDFEAGVDTLDLKALKGYGFIGEQAFTAGAKQLRVEVSGEDLILFGNSDKDSSAEFSIKLVGVGQLTVDDLVL